MEREQIERYLEELGGELTQRGFQGPIPIMIVGGVYVNDHAPERAVVVD